MNFPPQIFVFSFRAQESNSFEHYVAPAAPSVVLQAIDYFFIRKFEFCEQYTITGLIYAGSSHIVTCLSIIYSPI